MGTVNGVEGPSAIRAASNPGTAVRIYLHLRRGQEILPDNIGVEASGPDEARDQALQVIEELRQTDGRYWSGWSLVAADSAGTVLFTLDLDSPV